MSADREKRAAAEAPAMVVESGMSVGLGTGSTVASLLPALARRSLDIRRVATSVLTEHDARQLGQRVETFEDIDRFDVAIDGADQIAPDGSRLKGGGAAHTRENLVAAAAGRFVVIADSSKTAAAPQGPRPLELLSFGLQATVLRIGPVSLRDVPTSPDGGVIADYQGPVDEPATQAEWLTSRPGVVEHGLFPPEMVSPVLVGRGDAVDDIDFVPSGLHPSAPPTNEGSANDTPPRRPPNIRIPTRRATGARPDGERA
jgi:ribose 5-phosphate isomerase A